MTQLIVRINADQILDEATFHTVFAEVFGFPSFYGKNMSAWIDCMSYLSDPEAEMTSIHLQPGQILALVIEGSQRLKLRNLVLYHDLIECSAFVNWRLIEQNESPVISLAFYD